jgi:hypothetical protein
MTVFPKVDRFVSVFLFSCALFVISSGAVFAQTPNPIGLIPECADMPAETANKIQGFVNQLKTLKRVTESKVRRLKLERKDTEQLKNQYLSAREQTKLAIDLILDKPNSEELKKQFESAVSAANRFADSADIALNEPPTAIGGDLLGWINNLPLGGLCEFIPIPDVRRACKCGVKILKKLEIKGSNLAKWKDIKPDR